jgi:hypothetical protein
MVLNTGIPVLRKFMLKNLQKIPFGEGQVQVPIPALPGLGSKNPRQIVFSLYSNFQLSRCRNVEKIGNRRTDGQTDRGTISIEHIFLKTCSNKNNLVFTNHLNKKSDCEISNKYSMLQ